MAESAARLEYAGFANVGSAREFSFRVQPQGTTPPRAVVLVIADEAFSARHARLQDGPDICYQKLIQLLASPEPLPERIQLTEEDLYHYRHAHAPKPTRRRSPAGAAPSTPSPVVETLPSADPMSTAKAGRP
jgi:hypothetical protein